MASTNKTANYNLSQYIGTDKPTYLGDYNSDMSKIDAEMKTNADDILEVSNTADLAKSTADTAITNAQTAQSTAETADTTANSALSKATTNETNISSLQTSELKFDTVVNTINLLSSTSKSYDLDFSNISSERTVVAIWIGQYSATVGTNLVNNVSLVYAGNTGLPTKIYASNTTTAQDIKVTLYYLYR